MIENVLSRLIGLEMFSPARSVSIITFQIGRLAAESDFDKNSRGIFALHIQGHFRFHRKNRVFTGSTDIFSPRDELEDQDFDWKVPESSFFDQTVDQVFAITKYPWVISEISIDSLGDLSVLFANEFILNTFRTGILLEESWRIIEFGVSHFVMARGEVEIRPDPE